MSWIEIGALYIAVMVVIAINSLPIYWFWKDSLIHDHDAALTATVATIVLWPIGAIGLVVVTLFKLYEVALTLGRGSRKIYRTFILKREKSVDIPPARVVP